MLNICYIKWNTSYNNLQTEFNFHLFLLLGIIIVLLYYVPGRQILLPRKRRHFYNVGKICIWNVVEKFQILWLSRTEPPTSTMYSKIILQNLYV